MIHELFSVCGLDKGTIVYLRYLGGDSLIVNENFRVYDEVRDCKALFDELEQTLAASWDQMFEMARAYYEENGDLLPTASYTTADGYHLGQWIITQRINYRNHIPVLSEERIAALESIGMNWFTRHERLWEESFSIVKSYFKSNGSLDGLAAFSPKAYTWTKCQRQRYRNNLMPKEQVERLTAVGMIWEPEDTWQLKYEAAREYYFENGNLDIPATYVTGSGVPLGGWYRAVRSQYRDGILSEERIRMLEEIGINWVSVKTRTWMRYYEQAKDYLHTHGDVNILSDYVTENGMRLGVWISGQRYAYSKGKLPKEQIRLLEEIGISWDRDDSRWDVGYSFAQQYYIIHGNINVPTDYVTPDGYALGQWINMQRTRKKQGKVADKRVKKLDALGMLWDPLDAMWQLGYDHAKAYFAEHGNLKVPAGFIDDDGFKLGSWINNKRTRFKKGTLSEDRIQQLNGIGMLWSRADYKKPKSEPIAEEKKEKPTPFRYKAQTAAVRAEAM